MGEVLDEGDNMIVQDFKRLMEFYNHNKTFKVSDDECFMDISGSLLKEISCSKQLFLLKKN